MYLAYLDDSDTKAKKRKWQVMTAIIIKDEAFKMAGVGMSAASEALMGEENLEKFEEFHACELYGGHGAFQGIEQERRFGAIRYLLGMLTKMDLTVVYGAVDMDALRKDIYGSADPVDVCFRQCFAGIESWADALVQSRVRAELGNDAANYDMNKMTPILLDGMIKSLVILIVDECDGKTKNTLQQSFRNLRPRSQPSLSSCFHDDIYFGDSRYSIGIQLADLCSYFIARHLQGDVEIEGFYQMIEPRIYRQKSSLSNLESLMELTDGKSNESGVSDVREGDRNNPSGRPESGESRDGSGEAAASDGSGAHGKAGEGPTA